MQSIKQDFVNAVKVIILAVILTAGVSYAWTGPLHNPPTCNAGEVGCDSPINVGNVAQTKVGGLILGTGLGAGDNGLIIANGMVGIGNLAPTSELDVDGQIHATGDICTDAGGGKCLGDSGVSGGSATPVTAIRRSIYGEHNFAVGTAAVSLGNHKICFLTEGWSANDLHCKVTGNNVDGGTATGVDIVGDLGWGLSGYNAICSASCLDWDESVPLDLHFTAAKGATSVANGYNIVLTATAFGGTDQYTFTWGDGSNPFATFATTANTFTTLKDGSRVMAVYGTGGNAITQVGSAYVFDKVSTVSTIVRSVTTTTPKYYSYVETKTASSDKVVYTLKHLPRGTYTFKVVLKDSAGTIIEKTANTITI